jgi:hypothetical protein
MEYYLEAPKNCCCFEVDNDIDELLAQNDKIKF